MTDSNQKKDLERGTLQVPKTLSREIVRSAKNWDTTTYALVKDGWEMVKAKHKGGKYIPESPSSYSTASDRETIAALADTAQGLADELRRIANEESGNAGGDPDSIVEELEQATEVEELKVKAARPARKSPAADREGVTK